MYRFLAGKRRGFPPLLRICASPPPRFSRPSRAISRVHLSLRPRTKMRRESAVSRIRRGGRSGGANETVGKKSVSRRRRRRRYASSFFFFFCSGSGARKRGYELFLYYYYIIVLFYCIIVLLLYYSINSNLKVIWRIGFIFSLFFFLKMHKGAMNGLFVIHGMVTKECSPIDGFCFLIF